MALDKEAVLAFVAAHESEAAKEDLQYWLTTHMYLTGLYYGLMTTVRWALLRCGEGYGKEHKKGQHPSLVLSPPPSLFPSLFPSSFLSSFAPNVNCQPS